MSRIVFQLLAIFLLASTVYCASGSGSGGGNRVLLKNVLSLNFYADQWTNHRRVAAVKQMKCVGGTAYSSSYRPASATCYNQGFDRDGKTILWACKSIMNSGYILGSVTVNCEGYSYAGDPYVLDGSCALEYYLDKNDGRVLLKDVKRLFFINGMMTNHRRVSAVPQMQLVGGSAYSSSYRPPAATCYNAGTNSMGNVQWTCYSEMSRNYRLGRIEVQCEGYDRKGDAYVLEGSCALLYEMYYTGGGGTPVIGGGIGGGVVFCCCACCCIALFVCLAITGKAGGRGGGTTSGGYYQTDSHHHHHSNHSNHSSYQSNSNTHVSTGFGGTSSR